MALRVRQASDAVRDLQLRELYALGVQALIVSQRGVLNLGGRTASTEDDRLTISAWYDKNVPHATVVEPSIDDMWQLQAYGLVIQSSTAAEYEARLPPHGSIVASVWEQAGGSAYDRSSPAMALIEQLELGVDAHGDRAFERPSLAAYRLTDAGFLLGVMFLRQLAVDVPTNFSGWV